MVADSPGPPLALSPRREGRAAKSGDWHAAAGAPGGSPAPPSDASRHLRRPLPDLLGGVTSHDWRARRLLRFPAGSSSRRATLQNYALLFRNRDRAISMHEQSSVFGGGLLASLAVGRPRRTTRCGDAFPRAPRPLMFAVGRASCSIPLPSLLVPTFMFLSRPCPSSTRARVFCSPLHKPYQLADRGLILTAYFLSHAGKKLEGSRLASTNTSGSRRAVESSCFPLSGRPLRASGLSCLTSPGNELRCRGRDDLVRGTRRFAVADLRICSGFLTAASGGAGPPPPFLPIRFVIAV